MSDTAKRWALTLAILAIIVLLAAIGAWYQGKEKGWWGERSDVAHLRTHPLMAAELEGHPRVHVEHTEPVGFMGKASNPYYFGWYDSQPGSPEQLRESVIHHALEQGFSPDEALSTPEVAILQSTRPGEEHLHLSVEIAGPQSAPDAGTQFHGCVLVKLYYL